MSDPFPVIGSDGKMWGNLTSDQGVQPNTLPPIAATPTLDSKPSITNPSTWRLPSLDSVIKGMVNGPGATSKSPAASDSTSIDSAIKSAASSDWAQYIPRIAIILVGMIFILIGLAALGLSDIGGPSIQRAARALPT